MTSRLSFVLGMLLSASLLTLVSCANTFLSDRDADIKDATKAIETARDNIQRAKAYSSRGAAYSEKARFSRVMKRIANEEYEGLFNLAKEDHNQAVALNPASAEIYVNRGQMYYDRGWEDLAEKTDTSHAGGASQPAEATKGYFDAAAADFEKAAAMDPKSDHIFDMLGLTYEQSGQDEKAVQAYIRETALSSFGRQRLADLYCNIGFRHGQNKESAAAVAAYWKSLEFGKADDKSCPVEPLGALVWIYTNETHEYNKAWEAVRQARATSGWIASEVIDGLKRASGRSE